MALPLVIGVSAGGIAFIAAVYFSLLTLTLSWLGASALAGALLGLGIHRVCKAGSGVDKFLEQAIDALRKGHDPTIFIDAALRFKHADPSLSYFPVLHKAAWLGSPKLMEALLSTGEFRREINRPLTEFSPTAFPGTKAMQGYTPLHIAAMQGTKDVVDVLLKNGADVDSQDSQAHGASATPLCLAYHNGYREVAELLIYGANLQAQTNLLGP